MRTLYLDESGDHQLSPVDQRYPVFVLGGVIMDEAYAHGVAAEAVAEFKRQFFAHDDFVLHTAEITRNRGVFEPLSNLEIRDRFRTALNELLLNLEFGVVACVIDKRRFVDLPRTQTNDLYQFAFTVLVDRFCAVIGNRSGGRIRAERRRPDLDAQLLSDWYTIQKCGTAQTSAATIGRRIASFSQHPKTERLVGLELADLVVLPIGRHVAGYHDHADWQIVRSKFVSGEGFGLTIIPGHD